MKEIKEAIKNNKDERPYIKNKRFLKLYQKDSINEVPLSSDNGLIQEINRLETVERENNLKVYNQHMRKLRGKQTVLFGIPALAGILTIGSWFINKDVQTPMDVYQKVNVSFDEEHVIEYDTDDVLYAYSDHDIITENYKNITIKSGKATIYFGEGENSYQVSYRLNADNTWSYASHDDDVYLNIPDLEEENYIKELDEKYSKIIEEAAKIFINNGGSEEIVNEIIKNQKNDILVVIEKYEYIGKQNLEYNTKMWPFKILMIIVDVITLMVIFMNYDNLKKTKRFYSKKGSLYTLNSEYIKLKFAALEYNEAFLKAEYERISAINDILTKYSADKDILSEYEKKLCKVNNEKY